MKVEKVLEQLEVLQEFNRSEIDRLYRMDKEKGKLLYGSVKSFNEAKSKWVGKAVQIEELIAWFKYQSLK